VPWQLFPPERMPVPASGVLAPAEGATAAFGRLLVEAAVAELVAAVAALRQ
jgi:creatinine amidohydrolase/Fe(II)-dependent formamide hydrolase-like protein